MLLTLTEIRLQLQLEPDEFSDDLLTMYGNAASQYLQTYCNRPILAADDALPVDMDEDDTTMLLTDDLKIALLMLVGHYFLHRESTSDRTVKTVPMGFEAHADQYRIRLDWY